MDIGSGILLFLASSAFCAAVGGCVAYRKNDRPIRGCALGGLLGPLGIVLAIRKPFAHRPMVDRGAWQSFRSMVEHQSNREILQFAATHGRMLPAPGQESARSRSRSA